MEVIGAVVSQGSHAYYVQRAYSIDGEKLLFMMSDGTISKYPHYSESGGLIYTTGNGHNVGRFTIKGGVLWYRFVENSGDLRVFLDSVALMQPTFPIIWYRDYKGKHFEYRSFYECIADLPETVHKVTFKAKMGTTIVAKADYDAQLGRVTEFWMQYLPAECFNDVFKFMGKCKYVGDVHNAVAYCPRTIIDTPLEFVYHADLLPVMFGDSFYVALDKAYRGKMCFDTNVYPDCHKFLRYEVILRDGCIVAKAVYVVTV